MVPVSLKTIFARWVDAMDRRDAGTAYVVGQGSCAPTAHAAGSLQVDIAAGPFVSNAAAFATFAGGNKTPAAAVANAHVDLIYIDNAGVLQLAAGAEAAANPVPPALPAGALGIALVFVPPGAIDYTVATSAYIFDIRQYNVPMSLPDGTIGAPALAFGNELANGLYRVGATVLGVSGNLAIGASPATAGIIRIPNNTFMRSLNFAGNLSQELIGQDNTDTVVIAGNGQVVSIGSGAIIGNPFLSLGANPATVGNIRLNNQGTIYERNAANNADIRLMGLDGSNNVLLAPITTQGDLIVGGASGIAGRLAIGSNNFVLTSNGTTATWAASQGAALTTAEGVLGSDVTMTNANQYYDGPSVSLAAGTWLIIAAITCLAQGAGSNLPGNATMKIWDGTTNFASIEGNNYIGTMGSPFPIPLTTAVIKTFGGTTTVKASVASGQAGGTIKATAPDNGAGATASRIEAIKVG